MGERRSVKAFRQSVCRQGASHVMRRSRKSRRLQLLKYYFSRTPQTDRQTDRQTVSQSVSRRDACSSTKRLCNQVPVPLVMSSVKVECVVKESCAIGEGPVWEESEQSLLYVDIVGQKIHRWNPATNSKQSVATDHMVGFAVPRRSGGYVAGVGRSFVAVDWPTQRVIPLVEVDTEKPMNRFNDGKVDPAGRLLAGTMALEARPAVLERGQGSLYSLTSDLSLTKHFSQVDISNGLDWSPDGRTFYYVDSLSYRVDAFSYDPHTGELSDRRPVYRLEENEGIPDGLCVDVDGGLWVACFNGGRVINIDPNVGVRVQSVCLPVSMTTSCCFGGPTFSDLYVTSGSIGLLPQHHPLAGSTFRVSGLGVKGRPSTSFSG